MTPSEEARRLVTRVISASRKVGKPPEYGATWQRERAEQIEDVIAAQASLIDYAVRLGCDRDEAKCYAKWPAAAGPLYEEGGPITGVLDWLAHLERKAAA
jgi:hypothetical protein